MSSQQSLIYATGKRRKEEKEAENPPIEDVGVSTKQVYQRVSLSYSLLFQFFCSPEF